ncbi:MAG: O-antigen ligase family protein [Pyrinomonadaceae bacterium MAG19_C2-C3]|nr:O-antigen ligase family protein [Pyrinomonadaceae bacterium MAG19_C2-C3]
MYMQRVQQGYSFNPPQIAVEQTNVRVILFLAAHIPLGLAMFAAPMVATAHAVLVVGAGLWYAVRGREPQVDRIVYIAAYIVGVEVLWRMVRAPIFWESGKYAVALIMLVTLFRMRRVRLARLPLLYFVLLLPSTLLTIFNEAPAEARQQISFNLSGPLSLAVCAFFFSQLQLTGKQLQTLFSFLIAPVFGIAAVMVMVLLTNPDIVFTGESNRDVVAGFGPNQVSSILGLGVLAALFSALRNRERGWYKVIMFASIVAFAGQSALTFSRGGLYNAIGAAGVAFFFLMGDAKARAKFLVVSVLLIIVGNFLLLPYLDSYTGGALEARFQNVEPTGRMEILAADLSIWEDNPILGVGPGQAMDLRVDIMLAAHTEFSRLFAEHGIFGFIALLLLFVTGWLNLQHAQTPLAKAITAAMICWGFLYMLNAAMRLVAPSFIFGLSFATFLTEETLRRAPAAMRKRVRVPGEFQEGRWR